MDITKSHYIWFVDCYFTTKMMTTKTISVFINTSLVVIINDVPHSDFIFMWPLKCTSQSTVKICLVSIWVSALYLNCVVFKEIDSFLCYRHRIQLQLIWYLGLQSYRRIGVRANCANWRTQCHSIEISNKQQNQIQLNPILLAVVVVVVVFKYYYCIFDSPLENHISFTNTQSIITS